MIQKGQGRDLDTFTAMGQIPRSTERILVIFTSLQQVKYILLVSTLEVVPPFSTSDHNSISIDILYSKKTHTVTPSYNKQFLWNLGDYSGMCDFLASCNWNDLFMYNFTADNLWHAFREILDYAIEQFVPYKYVCCANIARPGRKYPRHIRELLGRKRCLEPLGYGVTTSAIQAMQFTQTAIRKLPNSAKWLSMTLSSVWKGMLLMRETLASFSST